VTRALAILKSFEAKPLQELKEVSEGCRLDKATARRLLLTLMGEGFVVQDEATQAYRLGHAVRRLAGSVPDQPDLRRIAAPVLDQLASELRMTAFLSVYRDHGAICIERFHDMHGMEVRWWSVGGTLPLNCGGAPKLLLALQSEHEVEHALKQPFVALTPKSIMDKDVLRRRLALIRKRGWELAVDDVALGLTALAVPLLDPQGNLVAAISLAGMTPQMVQRGQPVHLSRLLEAGRKIEARLA
jgi:DNA-binding IclR family transcriptional regulator